MRVGSAYLVSEGVCSPLSSHHSTGAGSTSCYLRRGVRGPGGDHPQTAGVSKPRSYLHLVTSLGEVLVLNEPGVEHAVEHHPAVEPGQAEGEDEVGDRQHDG